ncbi:MAG: fasciclin domain-containing protein [Aquabacterium sp.]|jgi:uncharacterized surface protein with fasciclin (FAS1) repeats|uniref:fasciclin domain-containing protein n=1 Tax=Aquabacterium sp. TaxID=1872578 RepID=UPI002A365F88|nr:fasciclin domain-containing protein [Aquabacterium sp.]MDX9844488.1 fasciclin domain-containing protein [Aquabacterium sp.]
MNTLSKRQFLKLSLASGVALSLSACGGGDDNDIVDVLSDSPEYSLLVEAVQAAGLVDTLKGRGPFTVFAPTNTAFVNLLGELGTTKDALFANKPLLTAVLTYHVLAARVPAADIPFGTNTETVQGSTLRIDNTAGGPVITDGRGRTSSIKVTNLYASNGVIHGVDKVILPPNTIPVALAFDPNFSILLEAIQTAGLVSLLQSTGPFTIFAPNNAAFAAALVELNTTKEALFANKTLLTDVLKYHVLIQRVLAADVVALIGANPDSGPISTALTGATFKINSSLQIIDALNRTANIVDTDVLASNGVLHEIDKVILPV